MPSRGKSSSVDHQQNRSYDMNIMSRTKRKWIDALMSLVKVCFLLFCALEMRRFLSIAIALQYAHLAIAGTSPLTGKDVVLMLRMGYSTEDIVRDLEAKHFVGP